METAIRTFKIEDYEQVFALWQESKGVGLSAADSKENIEIFLNRNKDLSLVAKRNGDIIGSLLVGTDGRRGYIHHLAVSSKYRRKGIGKALVSEGLVRLRKLKISKCHLFIFSNNDKGRIFWEKCGWNFREDLEIFSKVIE